MRTQHLINGKAVESASYFETVNPAIPSSIDAALLSKMAERGQIRGGVVDGPLAMDNAIDLEAARGKGSKFRACVEEVPRMKLAERIA